jgi:hypothetical protein
MIDINKEAQEFLNNKWVKGSYNGKLFIAGHNSKATQAKVLQAQIDVLKSIKTSGFEEAFICNDIYNKVIDLQQQLKELEFNYIKDNNLI